MNKLKVNLENAYGINKFNKEFDFSQKLIKNIYAPNGFMKSSFAKVFLDFSNNRMSKDEIYSHRTTVCEIKDENDNQLTANDIFVIESYSEFTSEKISTLLVNEELKREYDGIYNTLDTMKKSLLSLLNTSSGVPKPNIESEILASQIHSGQTLFETLEYVKARLESMSNTPLSEIKYTIVFNDKVKSFLTTRGIQENLQNYIEKYNSLIEQSKYLQRDFTHNNVSTISTTLSKNAELRNFRNLIENKPEFIIRLNDPQLLKQDLWISYFKEYETQIFELLEYYTSSKVRLLEIIEEAKNQETDWQDVVSKFNQKFNVPFKLTMENKSDVILNHDSPNISFIYNDGRGRSIN